MTERKGIDLDQALLDPGSVFRDPEEVLHHPELSRQEKEEILRRWIYDASELQVAEEEGMIGGESPLLPALIQALRTLTGEVDVSHSPPTKQEGI